VVLLGNVVDGAHVIDDAPTPERDQLRHDGDRDLLRTHGAEVEPDRAIEAIQIEQLERPSADAVDDAKELAPAPDEADVANLLLERELERALVELMIVDGNDDPVALAEGLLREELGGVAEDAPALGKALLGVELLAVVHHLHVEIDAARELGERLDYV